MYLLRSSPILIPALRATSLAPFLYALVSIIDSKITFYPFLKQAGLYDYEFVVLWLLLAPFVFMLTAPTQKFLLLARKIYWISVLSIVSLIVLVVLLIIVTGQI